MTASSRLHRESAVGRLPMMMLVLTESSQSELEVAKRVVWSNTYQMLLASLLALASVYP
jgi:hypothetical protein